MECRKCADCEFKDHHWLDDYDDGTQSMILICKHCSVKKKQIFKETLNAAKATNSNYRTIKRNH
jgi:hypothetical protein